MADISSLAQLTQELVLERIKDSQNPPADTADIVRQTILATLPSVRAAGQDIRTMISDICFGALRGVLLLEKEIPRSALLILSGLSDIAERVEIDPSDLMTWTMEGLARIAPIAAQPDIESAKQLIEQEFMGAGNIFGEFCRQAKLRNK